VNARAAEVLERREVEPQWTPPATTEMGLLPGAEDGKSTRAAPLPTTEVTLLQDAQDALRSMPAFALSLADQHAARFPAGALSQEREVIAIEALVNLGRMDEARARAARLFRSAPGTAYRPRVETLLGDPIGVSLHKP
jgi:hypothetical protein